MFSLFRRLLHEIMYFFTLRQSDIVNQKQKVNNLSNWGTLRSWVVFLRVRTSKIDGSVMSISTPVRVCQMIGSSYERSGQTPRRVTQSPKTCRRCHETFSVRQDGSVSEPINQVDWLTLLSIWVGRLICWDPAYWWHYVAVWRSSMWTAHGMTQYIGCVYIMKH